DCEADRMACVRFLGKVSNNTEFILAETGAEGLALLRDRKPDCVLLDLNLPDMEGIELVEQLVAEYGEVPVPIIMLTGQGNTEIAVRALKAGVADYLPKDGMNASSLGRAVQNAQEKHSLRTAVREHRRELEKMVSNLRKKNDEITRFYHTLSHELKTPLTAATEFVLLLLEGLAGSINEQQAEFLETVKESHSLMTLHINDILDATRLETGKLSLHRDSIALADLIDRVVATFGPSARDGGVRLEFRREDELPRAFVDERRITQVVSNLLANAIKFTPNGGQVSVSVGLERGSADRLRVSVADTGRGISQEQLPHIFDRLYQVTQDDTSIHGGLGLGLSISKDLVELHGGEISVASVLGEGSTFTFAIPAIPRGEKYLEPVKESVR
ncbi:MAG: hybrid sensor histidine kinase/response regulator, partial [Planctomycetota bacterium]